MERCAPLESPGASPGYVLHDGNYFDSGLFHCVVNKTQHLQQPAQVCMSSFYVNALAKQKRKKNTTMVEIELKFYFITRNGNYIQSFLFFSLFSFLRHYCENPNHNSDQYSFIHSFVHSEWLHEASLFDATFQKNAVCVHVSPTRKHHKLDMRFGI